MKRINFFLIPVAVFLIALVLVSGCDKNKSNGVNQASIERGELAKVKVGVISTPTIACGDAGGTAINIVVTAGATGLPAGFSLQWMTMADFIANGGWYLSDDPRLCKASFSGSPNGSRYNLEPNESVTVQVGDFLLDEGASTNCADPLLCNTTYVFRAFGHANARYNRSEFTADLQCSTAPCRGGGCTFTQGYWKTHPEAWPVTTLSLGSVSYTAADLLSILDQPVAGNGLISLAHQLIAAKLNVANGADPTDVADAIADADALIDGLVVPPVGTGSLAPAAVSDLVTALNNYNQGITGPGHCE